METMINNVRLVEGDVSNREEGDSVTLDTWFYGCVTCMDCRIIKGSTLITVNAVNCPPNITSINVPVCKATWQHLGHNTCGNKGR
ncbi:hypothetical protein J6590_044826 [Homalodisca vitripennis]|nr:hypothetical protein J6590_044826 [Homalodisca vitripennis]